MLLSGYYLYLDVLDLLYQDKGFFHYGTGLVCIGHKMDKGIRDDDDDGVKSGDMG